MRRALVRWLFATQPVMPALSQCDSCPAIKDLLPAVQDLRREVEELSRQVRMAFDLDATPPEGFRRRRVPHG